MTAISKRLYVELLECKEREAFVWGGGNGMRDLRGGSNSMVVMEGGWGGGSGEGEGDGDGGAEIGTGAGGCGVSAVLAGDVADQEEPEAGAPDRGHGAAGDAVETGEDALELVGRQADAGVGDLERDQGVASDGEGAPYVNAFRGVFDGVVQDVEDGGAQVFGDTEGVEADGAGSWLEKDAAGREMMALEGDGDAFGDEGFEVDEGAVLLAMALA